ncbi:AMP-binding protein [Pendulispora brunnea]|uniref:AMP-binding protein n=1 Tax=Pendulispora brunnea TaxID=2905690 RepID=A0ABZ2K7U2_9BACT
MTSPVLDSLLAPLKGRGAARRITFVAESGHDSSTSYADLMQLALARCAALRELDVHEHDLVMLAYPSSEEYLGLLLGCILAGVVPCTMPLPGKRLLDTTHNVIDVACRLYRPKVLFTTDGCVEAVQPLSGELGMRVVGSTGVLAASAAGKPPRLTEKTLEAPHHVQLTSGSVAHPKAAVLSHRNVLDNVRGIARALDYDSEVDRTVLWLPLYHDMGLITLLSTLHHQSELTLMQPGSFIRNPLGWLKRMASSGSSTTVAPTFALRYCLRRFNAERMQGVDLSRCRHLVVGAERVDEETLHEFARTFAPYGFRGAALQPCYGMAETTLAATMQRVTELPHPAPPAEALYFARSDAQAQGAVSVGKPLAGMEVAIRDERGHSLGERATGEVFLRGTSVMLGYLPTRTAQAPAVVDPGGWLATGDIGYVADGHLFILGRKKEIIIIRGLNYFPQEIEEAIADHPIISKDGCAAVGVHDEAKGTENLVLLIEAPAGDVSPTARAELQALLLQRIGFAAHDLVFVQPGALPRTTSGKLQRLKCRELLAAGRAA